MIDPGLAGETYYSLPWRVARDIERDAMSLLNEFARERKVEAIVPVPIDDIVEKHLKLSIELGDVRRLLDMDRAESETLILGAIVFDESRIIIDESLDPEEYPAQEASYRFTLAHELGHWRCHQELFGEVPEHVMTWRDPRQLSLFGWPHESAVAFRARVLHEYKTNPPFNAKIEAGADFHALCLLLPRDLIFAAWEEMYPDRKPRVLDLITPEAGFVEVPRVPSNDGSLMNDEEILERFCQPLSEWFIAAGYMRQRLETLGLLLRRTPAQGVLFPGLWPPLPAS